MDGLIISKVNHFNELHLFFYFQGFTFYYSEHDDQAFSPTNGILLADITRGVPIVSMYQKRTQRKGSHYSDCVDQYGYVGKEGNSPYHIYMYVG